MPTPLRALLIIGGGCAAALLAHRLVRRAVPLDVLEAHQAVAGILLSLVGGVYGVLLAFILVAVWQDFDDARRTVAAEANAAATLARLAEGLPAPAGAELHAEAVAYLESVVSDEWPRMAQGQESPEVGRHIHRMWRLLTTLEPATVGTRNVHLEALERMSEVAAQRRLRLLASRYRFPHLIWVVLILGGVATIGFVNFFGVRYPRSEVLMTGTVVLLVSTAIYTILALHQPFSGDVRVPPDDVREVLELLRDS